MAKVHLPFPLTGNLAGLSLYTRKDMEGVLARRPGGASKKRIRHDDSFEMTRLYDAEFSGCSTASKWLRRRALQHLEHLGDFNWAPALLGHLHALIPLDTSSKLGSRSVALSKNPSLVSEYPLTRRQLFDTVVRTSITWQIDKGALSATLSTGELLPGVNFLPGGPYPFFRFVAVLGAVPDLHHLKGNKYGPPAGFTPVAANWVHSEWLVAGKKAPATTLEMSLPKAPGTAPFTLVLSVGLERGTVDTGGSIETVRHFGCAKILGAV
ncbi:MAG TPA: hypothetical protein VGE66_13905 [Chitinophagaceae bacterium]